MLNQTQIDFLNEQKEKSSFFASLASQYERKGSLSPRQIECVQKAIDKALAPPVPRTYSLSAGEQIEIKGWLANRLKEQTGQPFFFRNLRVVEVQAESAKAYLAKVEFVSSIAARCHCCGRELDNEISRACGIGPVCAEKIGLERPTVETAHLTLAALDRLAREVGTVGPVWIAKSQIVREAA